MTVGFSKLTGYIIVEAALDELFLKDIGHVTYVCSDADWKPKEGRKHLDYVVSRPRY